VQKLRDGGFYTIESVLHATRRKLMNLTTHGLAWGPAPKELLPGVDVHALNNECWYFEHTAGQTNQGSSGYEKGRAGSNYIRLTKHTNEKWWARFGSSGRRVGPELTSLLDICESIPTSKATLVQTIIKAAKLNFYSDGSVKAHSDLVQDKLNNTRVPTTAGHKQDMSVEYKLVFRQLLRLCTKHPARDPHSVFMFKSPIHGWCVIPMVAFVPLRMYAKSMRRRHQHMNFKVSKDRTKLVVLPAHKTGTLVTDHCRR